MFITVVLISVQSSLMAVGNFKSTKSMPKVTIDTVVIPKDKSKPLQITITVTADGKTPLAINIDQLSVHISTVKQPHLFL